METGRGGFIAGNWKDANMTMDKVVAWCDEFNALPLADITKPTVQYVLFPPMSAAYRLMQHLHENPSTKKLVESGILALGGQDISHVEGDNVRYTGSHHPRLLRDLGMTYVLLGHSERRTHGHETNEIIAQKLALAVKYNVLPVLCVGESLEEKEAGKTKDVVGEQLRILDTVSVNREKLVVAYEPVWAIGTGKTATPEDANAICQFIREKSRASRVIYGGSVKAANAKSFFAQPHIDGALPGGASEQAKEFFGIARAALAFV